MLIKIIKGNLMLTIGIIGLLVLVIFIFMIIKIYNNLVTLRQQQKNAFSQIDVQLTRRYELIPNLVEVAKKYMAHEQETLEKVIQARNQAYNAKKNVGQDPSNSEAMSKLIAAEGAVKSQLGSFLAISESYPELRSNTNMNTLMEELSSTENKVSFARQAYNDATTEYNTARELFPSSVIAGMFNFAPAMLYEVEDQKVRSGVKVKFD
jgi:LemA protein